MAAPSGALRADLGAHVPADWPVSLQYNGSVDSSEEWELDVASRLASRAPRLRNAAAAFQYSGSLDMILARTLCNYPDKPVLLSRWCIWYIYTYTVPRYAGNLYCLHARAARDEQAI